MIKFNNILIVGLGMMGASLCKSIKKNKISKKITGFDTNSKSLDYALKNKIIDNAISKISDVTNSIHRMLAVHEEKLSAQEEAIIDSQTLVETRRMEFGDEIKQLHARITKNNEELITLMSKQHMEQQQELNNLRNCMNDRVAVFDKFRWILIGGSIVIGFILHKMMNIGITIG